MSVITQTWLKCDYPGCSNLDVTGDSVITEERIEDRYRFAAIAGGWRSVTIDSELVDLCPLHVQHLIREQRLADALLEGVPRPKTT